MFEFRKLCNEYEKLSAAERGLLLAEKSVVVLTKLRLLDLREVRPVDALAGFIVGSVVADGKLDEREYLLIYPALIRAFGYDFDFQSVKEGFLQAGARKLVGEYTREMACVRGNLDEDLQRDVITLCLCVTALDGKISLRERRYIRRLCKA